MTIAYILAVNPNILSETGMDKNALFTTTALSSVVATLVMVLWAKLGSVLKVGWYYNIIVHLSAMWFFIITHCCPVKISDCFPDDHQ